MFATKVTADIFIKRYYVAWLTLENTAPDFSTKVHLWILLFPVCYRQYSQYAALYWKWYSTWGGGNSLKHKLDTWWWYIRDYGKWREKYFDHSYSDSEVKNEMENDTYVLNYTIDTHQRDKMYSWVSEIEYIPKVML